MLGHALGCLGMRLDDFVRLTPEEFTAACRADHTRQESFWHDDWERMRMHAWLIVYSFSKRKNFRPRDLLPFGWDSPRRPAEPKEESRRRFEARLMRRKMRGKREG